MGIIEVTSQELRNKANELQNLNSQFGGKKTDLESKENSLVTMWEGSAKDAFHREFIKDSEKMSTFSHLIEDYVASLNDIATRYAMTEAKNAEIASARSY